jgi:transposase
VEEGERRKLSVLYPGLSPAYFARLEAPCYSPEEIACEKLSAILTRRDLSKPRDLVDLLRLKNAVDLPLLARKERAMGKIRRLIRSAPAYLRTFNERRKDVRGYLGRLMEEAESEGGLYIEPVSRAELESFSSKTLAPILEKIAEEWQKSA